MALDYPIWFVGSGSFGARCLSVISGSIRIERIITAFPKPAGRKLKVRATAVESRALELGLQVIRTRNINTDALMMDHLSSSMPGCILVVDFAQKIGDRYLSLPVPGCINIHPSLLPHYRGSAPVQRAIMNGETSTGVTVFRLVKELDAGPVLASAATQIEPGETSGDISERLAVMGSRLFLDSLQLLRNGRISFKEQDHEKASYAPRISKSDTELSWDNPSEKLHDLVRAMNPVPGCFVLVANKRLKVWSTCPHKVSGQAGKILGLRDGNPLIACGSGSLELLEVQPEGKKKTDGASWFRGNSLKEGDMLNGY